MQFARPAGRTKRPIDLGDLIARRGGVAGRIWRQQRRVRVGSAPSQTLACGVFADPRQAHIALTCLLRNAIEAAPAEGWAGVRVGPTPSAIDLQRRGQRYRARRPRSVPICSTRSTRAAQAGRGRGLGLPTAWRLAREHGGTVFFDDLSDGPTRFVLSLPRVLPGHAATNGIGVSANGNGESLPASSPFRS